MKRMFSLVLALAAAVSPVSAQLYRPVAAPSAGAGVAGVPAAIAAGPALDFTRTPMQLRADYLSATAKLDASLAAIVALPPEQATFANTIKAYEQATATWAREIRPIGFLTAVAPDPALRAAAQELDKESDAYGVALGAREDIYKAVEAAAAKNEDLDDADKRLRDDTVRDMRASGFGLDPAKRAKLQAMQNRLNELGAAFSKNLNEKKDSLDVGPEALRGLPEGMIKTLEETRTEDGVYHIPVDGPNYTAFMRYAESDPHRKAMLMKYQNRGGQENVDILRETLGLRRDVAQMLGYKSYPEMALKGRMAETPEKVLAFLNRVKDTVLGRARQDMADLLAVKRQTDPAATEVTPWERGYLSRQLRQQRYDFDPQEARPYFPVDRVAQGTMNVYQKTLGVSFREIKDAKTWAPGVRLFEISDAKSGTRIGHFYLDLTPRDGKRGHPSAFSVVSGRVREDGVYEEPVSAMVADFTPAAPGQPQLLSHDEVETFFHEFGHLMHQTLTNARYASYSGSSVARDFVEAPSQMLENFVWERSVIDELSGHFQTGEKLPDELFRKMVSARNFQDGAAYAGQVALAMGDMVLHTDVPQDVSGVFNRIMEEMTGVKVVPGTNFVAGFGHLFGYAAGYYGYLWSKVFAEDIYTFFKADGVISPSVGARYRREILEWGSQRKEMDSLRAFEGREPSEDAFMRELRGEPGA